MAIASYLRLKPLSFSSLPYHASLNNQKEGEGDNNDSTRKAFLTSILNEAVALVSSTETTTTTAKTRFKPDRKLRTSAPSTAKVQLFTSSSGSTANTTNSASDGDGNDYWVCRRSIHADLAQKGTASWSEFQKGLRENHSENEMDYTPTVASVEHLLQWPVIDVLDGWHGVDMHVNMITHTFKPAGLISPRTFISLVISSSESTMRSTSTENSSNDEQPIEGFYTIQIPLSYKDSQNTLPDALKNQITYSVPKNTIFAHYASVERVRLLPPATDATTHDASTAVSNGSRRIEWIMATTSDAGGLIPQWVQRSWTMGGVPKAVVADVGLFLGWTNRKRKS